MRVTYSRRRAALHILASAVFAYLLFVSGCTASDTVPADTRSVPVQEEWGIYELERNTQDVRLIYASSEEIYSSTLRLNNAGDRLVFARKIGGQGDDNIEIFTISINGENLTRLTNNHFWDVYPVWAPDDSRIAFLSLREKDFDIYVMGADGKNERKLFDSGFHDADIDWVGDTIVFTSQFTVWRINSDATDPVKITSLRDAGQWGNANLPIGDYDPRLSPDGSRIAFERLEDANPPNGGYNIFVINRDGGQEVRLTDTGYAQGLVNWSHSGAELVYGVAAINGAGKYDIYIMNSDGTENRNITPDYFPTDFLCHAPFFSQDDSKILFIGQRWE